MVFHTVSLKEMPSAVLMSQAGGVVKAGVPVGVPDVHVGALGDQVLSQRVAVPELKAEVQRSVTSMLHTTTTAGTKPNIASGPFAEPSCVG
jgi:hypothetical protein